MMTPTRKKRLTIVALIVLGVGAATAIAITALQDNMLFFVSPTDVHAQAFPVDRQIRLGGLVAAGTVARDPNSLAVHFMVTDGNHDVPVAFTASSRPVSGGPGRNCPWTTRWPGCLSGQRGSGPA
jgi:cytochrome c-type biogenesis protein CcmE